MESFRTILIFETTKPKGNTLFADSHGNHENRVIVSRKHMVKNNVNSFIFMFLFVVSYNMSNNLVIKKIGIKVFIDK